MKPNLKLDTNTKGPTLADPPKQLQAKSNHVSSEPKQVVKNTEPAFVKPQILNEPILKIDPSIVIPKRVDGAGANDALQFNQKREAIPKSAVSFQDGLNTNNSATITKVA